jgi:dTDP-L-rhamnose 4-epimerase
MKALVTGGAGLIGSHLADLLYERGYQIRILDNLEPETHSGIPTWVNDAYEFIEGDVKDRPAVDRALDGVDIVFHQAAYGGFAPEITKFVHANSVGTANIFDVIRERKLDIAKVVVASSQAVYGEGGYECGTHGYVEPGTRPVEQMAEGRWEVACPECGRDLVPRPTHEGKRIDPGIIYSITKYSQERMAIRVGRSLGIPTVALRYSMTYGPRQSLLNPYTGITSIFSTRILNGLAPIIYEDGHQKRDFVYVGDIAQANVLVAENDDANFQVFNVGTSKPTTVLEFVDTLNAAYGTAVDPILSGEFRPGEVRHLFSDSSRLRALGWAPQVELRDGIERYVEWIGAQGRVEEYFSTAYEKMRSRGIVMKAKGAS